MSETLYVKMSLKDGKITATEKKKDILPMKNVTKKKYIFFAWHRGFIFIA